VCVKERERDEKREVVHMNMNGSCQAYE